MFFARFIFGPAVLGAVLFSAGCDNTLALPLATVANVVDTVTLNALRGTPINVPSGFDVVLRRVARTDRLGEGFDIAFDIDEQSRALILTTGALGLSVQSAIQRFDGAFDDLAVAPLEDYERDVEMSVEVGSVFIVRSRPDANQCAFFLGQLPRYGKFEVLFLDLQTRQITLEHLVNVNCGYRGLEIGIPTR
ncbi:MAG: hypothetical protein O7F70_00915 [Gemmatimonadetes bacterium]|nr:hypothetical protein [Gemmatimonadota bacterium]